MNYPFGEISLDEFFENGTYDMSDTFIMYGLNGNANSRNYSTFISQVIYSFDLSQIWK